MSSSTSSVTLNTNSSSSSSIDQLVSEYVSSISQPVEQLQSEQSNTSSLVGIYNTIKTNLTNLQSQANTLASVGTLSPLAAETATASDSTILSATAENTATAATHSVLVTQLAKYDTLVSNQLSQSGTDISTASGTGKFTFSVTINGKATDINVNVNSGDSNSTVLANMAAAVNAANIGVTASVINDTASTARLVFASNSSGSANAVSVADVSGDLVQDAGWSGDVINSRTASTATGAGFVNSSINSLDANFILDGIPIVRGTNTISDVLTGVTLNLEGTQQATDNPVTLTIAPDTTSIQSAIQNFINAYNTTITSITQNTEDTTSTSSSSSSDSSSSNSSGTTVTRGPLAGDVTFMNLQMQLQNVLMGQVGSAQSGNPNSLSAIGITLNTDGTLSISNQSTLTAAITANPSAIVGLFNSSNGIAVQMNNLVKTYSNTGGTMDEKINGANDEISSLNDEINSMQANINEQANAMRDEFTAQESELIQLNQTETLLTSIYNSMSSEGLL